MKKYGWLVQYGVTMILALCIGALLSQVPLFHQTSFGTTKLRADQGVQFLGYAGALLVLWQFGQRLTHDLKLLPKMRFLVPVIRPFTTLLVLLGSHPICSLVLNPFLGKTGKGVYNWMFVIGIVSAALWVVISWYVKAAPLLQQEDEIFGQEKDRAIKSPTSSTPPSAMAHVHVEPV